MYDFVNRTGLEFVAQSTNVQETLCEAVRIYSQLCQSIRVMAALHLTC